jgi:hypothetical protein
LDAAVEQMVKDHPGLTKKSVVDSVQDVVDAQQALMDEMEGQLSAAERQLNLFEPQRRKKGRAPKRPTAATLAQERAKLRQAVDVYKGDREALRPFAKRLAEKHVELGNLTVDDLDVLVDRMYKELHPVSPDLTKSDVMELISDYGIFQAPPKDPVKRVMYDLRRQMQETLKLEDMAEGEPPKATGQGRPDPSDPLREKSRKVYETKKEGGFEVTDPERQLKTALGANKRRAYNQIKDISKELIAGVESVQKKSPSPTDRELEDMKSVLDVLREMRKTVFGKGELSEAQRLETAKRATTKAIGIWERRLQGEEPKRREPVKADDELKALRDRRDELKAEFEGGERAPSVAKAEARLAELEGHLRAGTVPAVKMRATTKNPRLVSLRERAKAARRALGRSDATMRAKYEKKITELERQIDEGDFAVPAPQEALPMSLKALQLKYRADRLKKQIDAKIDALRPKSFWEKSAGVLNISRALITSGEFSGVLRQGGFVAFGRPILASKGIPDMLKSFFGSAEAASKIQLEIEQRPNTPWYHEANLYLADSDILTDMEEVFMTPWVQKIPIVNRSARAYTTFLNRLRADAFDVMVENLGRGGQTTKEQRAAIAGFINKATGRGDIPNWAARFNVAFFAPRYVSSRFQLLAFQPLWASEARQGDKMNIGSLQRITDAAGVTKYVVPSRAQAAIAKEYARYLVGISVAYVLAMLGFRDREDFSLTFDPRSSDFGKIVLGDTRVDPLSGLSQSIVLLGRVGTGQKRSLAIPYKKPSEVHDLYGPDRPYGKDDIWRVLARFGRSKFSPVLSVPTDLLVRENVIGESRQLPSDWWPIASDLVVPLAWRDIWEVGQEHGLPEASGMALVAVLGMGVQVYGPRRPKKKPFDPYNPGK